MKTKSPQMAEIERAFYRQQSYIAKKINRCRGYVNEALNGKREFTENELEIIYDEMERRAAS